MELDFVSKRNYLLIIVRFSGGALGSYGRKAISFKSYPFRKPLAEYSPIHSFIHSFSQLVGQSVCRPTSLSPRLRDRSMKPRKRGNV